MVPMHGRNAEKAFHEPPPLPALSPASGGGEGGRRPGEGDSDWFMVPMHGKNGERAFDAPAQAWNRGLLGKAALKTHALQTLARGPLTRPCAKRLECVRFIGAFPLARHGQRFMVPMHAQKPKGGLSMNPNSHVR